MPLMTGMFQSSRMASGIALAHCFHGELAVLGFDDVEVEALEDLSGDHADDFGIVNDEARLHSETPFAERMHSATALIVLLRHLPRQPQR
jgi:hypothetical protein